MTALTKEKVEALFPAAEFVCPTTDKPAWLRARRTGITASDVGKILGVSPYGGPASVQAAKLSDDNLAEDESPEFHLQRGLILEKVIPDLAKAAGLIPNSTDVVELPLLRSKRLRLLMASCDRGLIAIDQHPGLLEMKTVARAWKGEWGEPGTGDMPEGVRCQTAIQRMVTGVDRVLVIALLGGHGRDPFEPTPYVYEKDPEFEANLEAGLPAWWERHIVNRVPLAPDGQSETTRAIQAVLGKPRRAKARAPDAMWPMLDRLVQLARRRKLIESEEERLTQEALLAMGEHAGMEWPGGSVSRWFVEPTTRFDSRLLVLDRTATREPDWDALAKKYLNELPPEDRAAVVADYTKVTRKGYPQFRVFPRKRKE